MSRKGSGRAEGKPSGRKMQKVTVTLDSELARRLAVVAAARRVTQSAVVAELLEPALRRWRIPSGPEGPAAAGDGREESAA